MRSMWWQLGMLGTISAFAYRHRETSSRIGQLATISNQETYVKCTKVRSAHRIPATCFGHFSDHPQECVLKSIEIH